MPRFLRTRAPEPGHSPASSSRLALYRLSPTPQAGTVRRQPFSLAAMGALPALALQRLWIAAALVPLLPFAVRATEPAIPDNLFKAEVIVTGKGEEERARGFREGLKEIFIKLSGDPAVAGSGGFAAYLAEANAFIVEYTYEDRMKHLPVRDEQGTRDRPHFLRMTAEREKTLTAIGRLGFQVWRNRPEIGVFLTVEDPRRTFIVGAEVSNPVPAARFPVPIASSRYDGYEQREVLKSIALHRGLTIILPDASAAKDKTDDMGDIATLLRWGSEENRRACLRLYLGALASGGWHLLGARWRYESGNYAEDTGGFRFEANASSFDTALRSGLDAFTAFLRQESVRPCTSLKP
jgi:uncharacterized protein